MLPQVSRNVKAAFSCSPARAQVASRVEIVVGAGQHLQTIGPGFGRAGVPEREEPVQCPDAVGRRSVGVEVAGFRPVLPEQHAGRAVVEQRAVLGVDDQGEVGVEPAAHTRGGRPRLIALGQQDAAGMGLVQPVGQFAPQRGRLHQIRIVLDQREGHVDTKAGDATVNQNAMISRSARRLALGPGASGSCRHGSDGSSRA